ncbi:MAG TPA: polysaccharide deacetylase family protein [Verrucomicrobiae bacterium]|nr:polysaccharide deacetylase family protein [Verrucomicrobiae bacterium]
MRLDRLITLGVVQPIQHAISGSKPAQLPILMYHSISQGGENAVSPYYRTATCPSVFAEHMALLHAEGYRVATLSDGLKALQSRRNGGGKTVVLTFDDGLRDFYTGAFPILRKYGQSASVFLPTAFIGDEPRQFKGQECMTWRDARELRGAGIEIGSHTVNHPWLYDLGFDEIHAELANSKATIEDRLGCACESFAYPYAFPGADQSFVSRFRDIVIRTGYRCCATTVVGRMKPDDDVYRLKRLPVNSSDDLALFRAKLEGCYDWLGVPQQAFKSWKFRFLGSDSRAGRHAESAAPSGH